MTPELKKEQFLADGDWDHIFGDGGYASNPTAVRARKVHEAAYGQGDVDEVIATAEGENDGEPWVGLFRMTDGLYLVVRASCDYTGWGCGEGGSADVADTVEDAIYLGLTREERDRLSDQISAWAIP